MSTILRYYITGSFADLLDLRTPGTEYTLVEQQLIANGSGGVNTIWAAAGVDLDARNLFGGIDLVLFNYSWDQYTKDISTVPGAIVFSYTDSTSGLTEKVTVANGATTLGRDLLIFADGAVGTQQANAALQGSLTAAINTVSAVNNSLTSAAYTPTALAGNTLRAFASTTSTTAGATFAMTEASQSTVVTGTGQSDKVYVKAGATVDARNLLGGEDQIYLTGNWADYTKSLTEVSGAITFTRSVNGFTEKVTVANGATAVGRDKLVFADGAVLSHNARTALTADLNAALSAVTGFDTATQTPFLTFDFSNKTPAEVAAYLNNPANSAKLGALSTAQGQQIGADDLDQVNTTAFAALSTDFIDGLSSQVVASLPAELLAVMTSAQAAVADLSLLTGPQVLQLRADAIDSVPDAVLSALTAAQVAALSNEQLTAITPAQSAAITAVQVDALSAAQVAAITPDALAGMSAAALASLNATQVASITATQIDALGTSQLVALTPEAMAGLSPEAVGSLSAAQLGALSTTQLDALSPAQVAAISSTAITALTPEHLSAATPAQLGALTSAQIAALEASGDMALLSEDQRALLVNDTTPPAPLQLSDPSDSGVQGDNITSNGTFTVTGLEAGATWEFSTNSGSTWVNGTGSSFVVSHGDYSANQIQVRQTDVKGNVSSPSSFGRAVGIDTQAPQAPLAQLQTDTGRLNTDGRTNDADLTVTGLEDNATLQVQVDGGAWSNVVNNTLSLTEGTHTYAVRQVDAAGNTGASSAAVSYTLDTTPPALAADLAAAYFVTDLTQTLDRGTLLQGKGAPANGSVTITFAGQSAITVDTDAAGNWAVQLPVAIAANTTATLVLTNDVGTSSATSGNINLQVSANVAPTLLASLASPELQAGQDTGADATDGISTVTTPTLVGRGAQANATITVFVDGVAQANPVTADGTGNWTYTFATAFAHGQHNITVTQSAAGFSTSAQSPALAYTLDTTIPAAPAALSVSVDSGTLVNGVTNDNTPTISGTAEAGATVEIRVGGIVRGTSLADANGNWRYTLGAPLADGTHQIEAKQTDAAGNAGPLSTAISLRVDTAAARLSTFTISNDAGTAIAANASTNDAALTLSGTGAEAGAVVTIFANGAAIGNVTAAANGSWTFTPATALSAGQQSFTAQQTDALGNVSALSKPQVVTVTAPVSLSAPTGLAITSATDTGTVGDNITSNLRPVVTGNVSSAQPGMTVEVRNGTTVIGTAAVNAITGAWSLTPSADLPTGVATLTAVLIDATGNRSAASSALSLTLDNSVPVALSAPVLNAASDTGRLDSDGITQSRQPTFTGSGAPATATVQLLVNGSAVGTTVADASGNWSFTPSSLLATGTLQVTSRVVSVSGATGVQSPALAITIDNGAPASPVLDASLVGATINGANTLFGTAEANARVTISITPAGGDAQTVQVLTNAAGVWQYTPSVALSNGAYTVVLTATDVAGNNSAPTAQATVTVSAAATPVPSVVLDTGSDSGVAGDGITNDTTPTFNISGIDATATAVEISTNGGSSWSAVAFTGGNTTASFTPSTALAGSAGGTSYSVQVRQTVGGQTSVSSVALPVTIDSATSVSNALPAVELRSAGYLSTSGLSLSTGLTIEAWMKLDNVTGTKNIFTLVDENNSANFIRFIANGNAGRIESTLNGVAWNSGLDTGVSFTTANAQWAHVAFRIADNGALNLVVNGVANTATTIANFATNMPSSTTWTLRTGASNTGNGTFSGLMRELQVWDTARTNAEIGIASNTAATDRNSVLTGAETGLVLYAPLNDASGSTALHNTKTGTSSVALVNGAKAGVSDVGSVSNAPVHNSGPVVTLTGTAEAGSTVVISEGGTTLATLTVSASGQWSTALTGQSTGAHTYTVGTTDVAGNTASATRTLTVDGLVAPSEIPLLDGLAALSDTGVSGDGVTNLTRPVVSGSGPLANAIVQVLNASGSVLGTGKSDSSGNWSATLSAPLSEGTNTLTARYVVSGAVGSASAAVNITLDSTLTSFLPGAVFGLSVASDGGVLSDNITNATQPAFSGTGAPASGTVVVTFTATGQTTQTVTVQANPDGSFNASPSAALTAGAGTVWTASARVQDSAGNLSAPITASVTVDTQGLTAPSITAPAGNLSPSPFVSGNAPANTDVWVYDNATNTLLGRTSSNATGTWNLQLLGLTKPGSLTLRAEVQDVAGNITSGNRAITVDLAVATPVAPGTVSALTLSGSASASLTNSSTPTLIGVADPGVTVNVYNGSTLVGTAVAQSNGTFSATLSSAVSGDGLKTLTVQAVSNGIAGPSASFSYTLDTTAPAAPAGLTLALSSDSGVVGDGMTSVTQPTFRGTGVAGSTITLRVNGTAQAETTVVGADGTWSLASTATLADGVYSITALATDAAGNASVASAALSTTVRTSKPFAAPTVLLDTGSDSGVAGDGITNDTTPTFNISGIDATATAVEISTNGGSSWSAVSFTAGNTTATYTPDTALTGSASGTAYSVLVRQTGGGQTTAGSTSLPIRIDTSTAVAAAQQGTQVMKGSATASTSGANAFGASVSGLQVSSADGATLAFWYKAGVIAGGLQQIFGGLSELYINAGTLRIWTDGETTLTGSKDTAWHFYAVTYVNGTMTVFQDGVSIGSRANAANNFTTANLSFMSHSNGSRGATGEMRDIQVWDTALTTTQITAAATGPSAVSANSLVAWWPLNGSTSSLVSGAPGLTLRPGTQYSTQTSPTNALVQQSNQNVLQGTAESGSTVILSENGAEIGRTVAGTSGAWSLSLQGQAAGAHTYVITTTDKTGNTTTTNVAVTMPAAVAVQIQGLTSATDSSTVGDGITNAGLPVLQGTANAGDTVTVSVNNVSMGTTIADGTGAWTFNLSGLTDGDHRITASNGSVTSGLYIATKDSVAPTLSALSGLGSARLTPTFGGTTEVGATVSLNINGVAYGQVTAGPSGTFSLPMTVEQFTALAEGSHSAQLRVIDRAGNLTVTDFTWVKDTQTSVTVNTPSGTQGSSFALTGVAEAGATVVVSDATGIALGQVTAGNDGSWALNLVNQASGNQTLTVRATDTVGNTAQQNVSLTVDANLLAAPVLTVASDTGTLGDGTTNLLRPTLLVSGAAVGQVVQILDGSDMVLGSAVVGSNGQALVTLVNPLTDGTHNLRAREISANGTTIKTSNATAVTVDTTAPTNAPVVTGLVTASDSGVVGDNTTNDSTPTVQGTAAANAVVLLYVDGSTTPVRVLANESGAWSWTSNLPLTQGAHTVQAVQQDAAGNVSGRSNLLSLTVDAIAAAPTITVLSGTNSTASPMLQGTAEAGATVTVRNGSNTLATVQADSAGNWRYLLTGQVDGSLTVSATQTDVAGNVSAANAVIATVTAATPAAASAYDTLGPVVLTAASDTGVSNSDRITRDTTPTLQGSGAVAGATVRVFNGSTLVGQAVADGSGNWNLTTSALPNGNLTLTVQQVKPDNTLGLASSLILTVDTLVSTGMPNLSSPTTTVNGVTYVNVAMPVVSGSSNEAGATVQLLDASGNVVGTSTVLPNGSWSVTPAQALAQGSHSLTVRISDVAGNVSVNSPPLSFTVDTQIGTPSAPTLVTGFDTGSLTNDGITRLGTVTLQGQGAEPGATLMVFNGASSLGSTSVGADGRWTLSVTLPAGTHSLMARQTDVAGNISALSGALNLTVDTSVSAVSAPQLLAADDTGTQGDATTTKALARITGTGAEANARIDVYANGVYRGSTQTDGAGAWQFTPTGVWGSGMVSITAQQTDAAGNVSSASPALALNVMAAPQPLAAPTLANASSVAATLVAGQVTNSTTPTVQGSGAVPGATVTVFNGSTALGHATADGAGNWSLTLSAQTDGGTLSLSVSQTVRGHESERSAPLTLTVNAAAVDNAQLTLATSSDSGLAGDRVTHDTTPTLQGTFAGQANVVVTIAKDGTTVGQALTDANGRWSFTSANLTAGVHSFTAIPAGGSASQALVLTVDNSVSTLAKPVLSADSDTGTSNSDGMTSLRNVTLTGTGAEAGATVEALVGNVVVGRALASADGSYAVQVQGLADGANSLTVRQIDLAGNQSAASNALALQVVVKAAANAPVILGISTATDSGLLGDNTTTNSTPVLQGNRAEANATVQVWSGSTLLGQARADANGNWSVTLSALPNGANALVARQVDVAGNVSADSASVTLTLDTSANAPTLSLLATADNDTGVIGDGRTQNNRPIYQGTAEAGATVTLWRTDQGTPQVLATAVANASGNWQTRVEQTLLDGNYEVAVSQTDLSGNTSALSSSQRLHVLPRVNLDLSSLLAGGSSGVVQLKDVNGDGLVDVISGTPFIQQVNGSFKSNGVKLAALTQLSDTSYRITGDFGVFMDVDGDGRLDFLSWDKKVVLDTGESFALNMNASNYYTTATGSVTNLLGYGVNTLLMNGGLQLQVANFKYVGIGGNTTGSSGANSIDINGDGYLDAFLPTVGSINNSQGQGVFRSTLPGISAQDYRTISTMFDANGDGLLDYYQPNGLYLNQGAGQAFKNVTSSSLPVLPFFSGTWWYSHAVVADFNADGQEDILLANQTNPLALLINYGGVFSNQPTTLVFEQGGVTLDQLDGVKLAYGDLNGDRAIDMLFQANGGILQVKLNQTVVAENTYLRVVVTDALGEAVRMTGAEVRLYDHDTGAFVGVRTVGNNIIGAYVSETGQMYAEFFGLDPAKTYDVAVRYPGNDQGVYVVSGRAGLGTDGIASGVLRNIVDSTLSAVAPGGKDVLYVAPEAKATATTGGVHLGSNLADWMVGDAGNDTFTPNGARLGEAGDTIDLRNGGSDTIIFQQVANLNTAATVMGADLSSALASGGDVIDVSGLLTAIGYTGARSAADVATVLRVVANGTGLTLQANKPGVGFQDLAQVQPPTGGNISGKTLADLVASGHLRLGGLKLSGVGSLTVDENTAQLGAVGLFNSVALSAEGGVYSRGFNGGTLRVSLDNAYAEDRWVVTAGAGVTVSGSAVSVDGNVVATVDSTANGQGTDLLLNFNFSGSSLTEAQQAAVVQRVAQAIDYTNTGSTPPDYARSVKLTVSDGAVIAVDASLLTVTPTVDVEVLAGVRTVTGNAAVNTLAGTAADETFVGYGGPVANASTSSATGDTLTGGGGTDTYVYRAGNVGKDTITDFTVGEVGVVAGADKLNLSDLLKGYFTSGTSSINDFVRLEALSTTGTKVLVDFNGKADGSTFLHYMEVDLTGVTLASTGAADFTALRDLLINTNHQIILA